MTNEQTLATLTQVENWAQAELTKYPHDGICIHILEQLPYLRRALQGDRRARRWVVKNFDLGIMAVKALDDAPEYAAVVDQVYQLAAAARNI